MKGKIFTPDEANRMLPLVSRIVDDIVGAYRRVNEALRAFEDAKQAAEAAAEGVATIDAERAMRRCDEDVARQLDGFQRLIEEIENLGGTVKDYERGTVDFYGEVDGDIVYLSWRPGDDRIEFWRRLEDGFSKRRPLPATVTL